MPPLSKRLGLYLRAQSTLLHWLGLRRAGSYGYYIPYRYAGGVTRPGEADVIPWLQSRMDAESAGYLQTLSLGEAFAERLAEFRRGVLDEPRRPRFDQVWFTGLDAAMAYTLVRSYRPRLILEVGSGHSTRFLAQALSDGDIDGDIHSVDPAPRRFVDDLCASVHRGSVTELPASYFERLGPGDVLFIDSSHVSMPGSDVDFLLTRVLPVLRPGTLVHVHDIFLPGGYPQRWPWREYTEQHQLLAVLAGGARMRILCPSAYLRRCHGPAADRVGGPAPGQAPESSFWMEVAEP
jgi:hypothetical protein